MNRSCLRATALIAVSTASACGWGRTDAPPHATPPQAARAAVDAAAESRAAPTSSAPTTRPDAAASASTPADAGPPPRVEGSTAVTRFFEVGKKLRFTIVDLVDTHDPQANGPTRTAGEATVVVRSIHGVGATVIADVEWELPSSFSWVSMPERWALRDGALWVLDTSLGPEEIVTGDDGIETAIARTPPILAAAAARRLTAVSPPTCKEARDKSPYGATLLRACFDAQGLVSWLAQNLNGPRRLSLTRR